MKNSLKQMLRTPVRTGLFFVLMIFSALLMTLGACIWVKSYRTMVSYENRFITIGTVRQIPRAFEQTMYWDAAEKRWQFMKNAQYSSYYTTEDLEFPGAEYIAGPEQRAFYGSYTPEYLKLYKSKGLDEVKKSVFIAEFSPLEDCIPNESVNIQITKIIGGDSRIEGSMEYFCDHMNPAPDRLYKDKTYVAVLESYLYVHGAAADEIKKEASASGTRLGLEYIPASLASGLYLPDGSIVEDEFREKQKIYEVTEDFYETDAGKRLLNLAKTMEYTYDIQPVTGTNKTCLLMPFYNGDSYICQGRDISEKEYADGSKVCLAPKTFMENNGLSLGDNVKVALLYADTNSNAGRKFRLDGSMSLSASFIDAEGNPLEPFETSEYKVVGIYDTVGGNANNLFRSGSDELIIPMESIQADEGKNLLSCGPMTDTTSSFQIPNGTIDEFLEKYSQYGRDDLEFTFYDRGYSQLKEGIDNMKNLSFFLLLAGIILTGLLLFFFSHLFISKQAAQTAIERSLGMTCSQCRWSIMSGFVLMILFGSIIGSLSGALISNNISAENAGHAYYDMAYTVGNANALGEDIAENMPVEAVGGTAFGCMIMITALGTGIALSKINKSLKREPMQLLAERRKE